LDREGKNSSRGCFTPSRIRKKEKKRGTYILQIETRKWGGPDNHLNVARTEGPNTFQKKKKGGNDDKRIRYLPNKGKEKKKGKGVVSKAAGGLKGTSKGFASRKVFWKKNLKTVRKVNTIIDESEEYPNTKSKEGRGKEEQPLIFFRREKCINSYNCGKKKGTPSVLNLPGREGGGGGGGREYEKKTEIRRRGKGEVLLHTSICTLHRGEKKKGKGGELKEKKEKKKKERSSLSGSWGGKKLKTGFRPVQEKGLLPHDRTLSSPPGKERDKVPWVKSKSGGTKLKKKSPQDPVRKKKGQTGKTWSSTRDKGATLPTGGKREKGVHPGGTKKGWCNFKGKKKKAQLPRNGEKKRGGLVRNSRGRG